MGFEVCSGCHIEDECLFSGLPDEDLTRFKANTQQLYFGPGRTIFEQQEKLPGIYILRKGLIRKGYTEEGGRRVDIETVRPSGILGLPQIAANVPTRLFCETATDCEVEFVQRTFFVAFLFSKPALAIDLFVRVSQQLDAAVRLARTTACGQLPARSRLLSNLLVVAEARGVLHEHRGTVEVRISVQELADRAGLSRPWASRMVAAFAREGLIRRRGKTVLLDPDLIKRTIDLHHDP